LSTARGGVQAARGPRWFSLLSKAFERRAGRRGPLGLKVAGARLTQQLCEPCDCWRDAATGGLSEIVGVPSVVSLSGSRSIVGVAPQRWIKRRGTLIIISVRIGAKFLLA